MRFRARLTILFGCAAVLYAFLLLAACGVVSLESWHSASPWFRFQTDAFLRGNLALSHNPLDLTHDLCWSERGVHQVWGLGIPLWQLPFAALGKLFGLSPFPDRVALGLFIALVAYVVLMTWFGPLLNRDADSSAAPPPPLNDRCAWFRASGVVLLSLFFPPLINLMRYRMLVYEEVMVYVYFWSILLLCGVMELARKPRWRRFWLLCILAGLGGFIRPTLEFCGFATILVAAFVMASHEQGCSESSPKQFGVLKSIFSPTLLFRIATLSGRRKFAFRSRTTCVLVAAGSSVIGSTFRVEASCHRSISRVSDIPML